VPNEMVETVARAGGDSAASIHVVEHLSSRRQKLVELAVRASAVLRDGARLLARWAPLLHDGLEGALEEGASEAQWVIRTPRRPRGAGRHVHEIALAHALRELRAGVDGLVPSRVWFAHPRPPELDELRAFFGTPNLSFGHEQSGFALRPSDLGRAMRGADARTVETIAPIVDADLTATASNDSFAMRVRTRIASSLPDAVEVSSVARALHMSTRTLQRRLEDEGTHFTEVLDHARLDAARRLLADRTNSLIDVAFHLGFADLATFSRAFKRWTGQPPGQWRRS
jgi:AraC-like DNA-binding protein